jgi:hypothetical protein
VLENMSFCSTSATGGVDRAQEGTSRRSGHGGGRRHRRPAGTVRDHGRHLRRRHRTGALLVAPLFQQAFICGVGAGVAESGAGLIEGFPYTGPFEHLELKERQPP